MKKQAESADVEKLALQVDGLKKLVSRQGKVVADCVERLDRLDKWIGLLKR